MDENQKALIAQTVLEVTGVAVEVTTPRIDGVRGSLFAYIDGYTTQNGPRFTIKPHGLKSHQVIAEMGTFAMPCIKQMQSATADQLSLARCLIRQIAQEPNTTVSVGPDQTLDNWIVTDTNFHIEAITRVVGNQYDDDAVAQTATKFIAPMLAALAELIGYEEQPGQAGENDPEAEVRAFDEEGTITTATLKKRERSRRNRLLCIAIHGDHCAVCSFVPETTYPGLTSIIEVHHIEPLSQIEAARIYDPRTDLIPLCPNCHRAIHRRFPAFLPEELRNLIILPT